jgi:hypothetical protein
MKECAYCGAENEDSTASCRGCATRFPTPTTDQTAITFRPLAGMLSRQWRLILNFFVLFFWGLFAWSNYSLLFFWIFLGGLLPVFVVVYTPALGTRSGMRVRILFAVCALSSFALTLALPYGQGWTNSVWSIFMLPSELFPWLWLLICCTALFVLGVASIFTKRHRLMTWAMFLLSMVLAGSFFVRDPAGIFLRGFDHYVSRTLGNAQWREISQFLQTHPPPDGRLPGPRKNLWNEAEDRAPWTALCAATQIQKLDPSLVIFVHDGRTEII